MWTFPLTCAILKRKGVYMMPQNRIELPLLIKEIIEGDYYTTVGSVFVDSKRDTWLYPDATVFPKYDDIACVKISRYFREYGKQYWVVDFSQVGDYKWRVTDVPNIYFKVDEVL